MKKLPDDYPILLIVPGAIWLLVSALLGYVLTFKLDNDVLFFITAGVIFVVGMAIYVQYFDMVDKFFAKSRKQQTSARQDVRETVALSKSPNDTLTKVDVKALPPDFPEQLKGRNTLLFLTALSKEGFIGKDFRPLEGCNKTEMAFIVDCIASICNISNHWKTFEGYWHLSNLRQLLGTKNQRGSHLDREETIIDVFKAVAEQNPAIKDTKSYARWLKSVQE